MSVHGGFLCGSAGKEYTCNAGDHVFDYDLNKYFWKN